MKVVTIDGMDYRLPNGLNDFQLRMYVHLIRWKWKHITEQPGYYDYRGRQIPYDAILPAAMIDELRIIYPAVRDDLREHQRVYPFRLHTHFNHMASSQAANINLFLPILRHPQVDAILGALNPEYARLATDRLHHGCRIEFWDEPFGTLGDKTESSGTDSDLAIAYYNHSGEPCLWLIEHKLTESEFTSCGGFKSKDRETRHDCTRGFADILHNKHLCFHHDIRKRHYWEITERNREFFVNHAGHAQCPFQGGMNQLWRNQLMALAIEQDERQPYVHASFSVVKHPGNKYLDERLEQYGDLIGHDSKFSMFNATDVLRAVEAIQDQGLADWVQWYRELYLP